MIVSLEEIDVDTCAVRRTRDFRTDEPERDDTINESDDEDETQWDRS